MAGALGAYTRRFQETTLELGRRLGEASGASLQDAITPRSQVIRNILFGILLLSIIIVGTLFKGWLWGVGSVVLTLLVLVPLFSLAIPRPCDPLYLRVIRKDLERRRRSYEARGDKLRETAVASLLVKIGGK